METQGNDEIGLQDVVVRLIKILKSHLSLFYTFSVLGMVIGLGIWLTSPNVYQSKMIIMSDMLIPHSFRIADDLGTVSTSRNLNEFAHLTNITVDEADKILKLKIETIEKLIYLEKEQYVFEYTAEVLDTAVLPRLQDGIIYFLRNNEFIQTRIKQRRELDIAMLNKIEEEIKSLEELKTQLFQKGTQKNSALEDWLVDPSAIYTTLVKLTKDKITYQNDLEMANSIHLVQGFTLNKTQIGSRLLFHLVLGLLLGFLGAILVLVVKKISDLIKS